MAITRSTDAALVKMANPDLCVVRRKHTAAAFEAGETCYLDSSGYAALTDAAAVATNFCYGMALEDIASGGDGDFCLYGPVVMGTGGTPGAICYTKDSTDIGEIGESAGTKTCIVGVLESATTIFVNPQMVSLS